jgi:hypothetical protein
MSSSSFFRRIDGEYGKRPSLRILGDVPSSNLPPTFPCNSWSSGMGAERLKTIWNSTAPLAYKVAAKDLAELYHPNMTLHA